MGKERYKLIRRYCGVPISEERPSDAELMRRCMERYACEGRLPPEIAVLRLKQGLSRPARGNDTTRRSRRPREWPLSGALQANLACRRRQRRRRREKSRL